MAAETVVLAPPVLTELDVSLADLVMFPVPRRFDPEPDPIVAQVDELIVDTIDHTIADAIDDTIEPHVDEMIAPAVQISRFAANGIDDDLLPVPRSAPPARR